MGMCPTDMLGSLNYNINTYSICYNYATYKQRAAKHTTLYFLSSNIALISSSSEIILVSARSPSEMIMP